MQRSTGINIGTKLAGNLPNITGSFIAGSQSAYAVCISPTGVFYGGNTVTAAIVSSGSHQSGNKIAFDAHRLIDIYDPNADGVYPKHLVMNFYIKY